jgi:hypothetical protein
MEDDGWNTKGRNETQVEKPRVRDRTSVVLDNQQERGKEREKAI